MGDKYLKISFIAPALVLDFLSFVYRITYVDHWKTQPNLMDGFYRTDDFSIAARVSSWESLFFAMTKLSNEIYMNRNALLAFAVYVQTRNLDPKFSEINMPDFISGENATSDIAASMSIGIFESCMDAISTTEISNKPFKIDN